MIRNSKVPRHLALFAALVLIGALGGCVVYPAGPGYGYDHGYYHHDRSWHHHDRDDWR